MQTIGQIDDTQRSLGGANCSLQADQPPDPPANNAEADQREDALQNGLVANNDLTDEVTTLEGPLHSSNAAQNAAANKIGGDSKAGGFGQKEDGGHNK